MYYRIHDTRRSSPEQLLDPQYQRSEVWEGSVYRVCYACSGMGLVDEGSEHAHSWRMDEHSGAAICGMCDGHGKREITVQRGVSCCTTLRELEEYMDGRSPDREGAVLVEFEGYELQEPDCDAHNGAVLVIPTRIVSVRDVDDIDINWLRY